MPGYTIVITKSIPRSLIDIFEGELDELVVSNPDWEFHTYPDEGELTTALTGYSIDYTETHKKVFLPI